MPQSLLRVTNGPRSNYRADFIEEDVYILPILYLNSFFITILFIFLTSERTNLMNLTPYDSLGYPVLKGPDSKLRLAASSTTVSCSSLKVESKPYHLQAASKSSVIP